MGGAIIRIGWKRVEEEVVVICVGLKRFGEGRELFDSSTIRYRIIGYALYGYLGDHTAKLDTPEFAISSRFGGFNDYLPISVETTRRLACHEPASYKNGPVIP